MVAVAGALNPNLKVGENERFDSRGPVNKGATRFTRRTRLRTLTSLFKLLSALTVDLLEGLFFSFFSSS
jgi:hypothetical protein